LTRSSPETRKNKKRTRADGLVVRVVEVEVEGLARPPRRREETLARRLDVPSGADESDARARIARTRAVGRLRAVLLAGRGARVAEAERALRLLELCPGRAPRLGAPHGRHRGPAQQVAVEPLLERLRRPASRRGGENVGTPGAPARDASELGQNRTHSRSMSGASPAAAATVERKKNIILVAMAPGRRRRPRWVSATRPRVSAARPRTEIRRPRDNTGRKILAAGRAQVKCREARRCGETRGPSLGRDTRHLPRGRRPSGAREGSFRTRERRFEMKLTKFTRITQELRPPARGRLAARLAAHGRSGQPFL
jgi:hypothetical protein